MVDIIDFLKSKKRSIGAILLAIAIYLYLQGYETKFDTSSSRYLFFFCLLVGIIAFFYDFMRRQQQ